MKYLDQQRIQKIYEKAEELHEYIVMHRIKKEDLLTVQIGTLSPMLSLKNCLFL